MMSLMTPRFLRLGMPQLEKHTGHSPMVPPRCCQTHQDPHLHSVIALNPCFPLACDGLCLGPQTNHLSPVTPCSLCLHLSEGLILLDPFQLDLLSCCHLFGYLEPQVSHGLQSHALGSFGRAKVHLGLVGEGADLCGIDAPVARYLPLI